MTKRAADQEEGRLEEGIEGEEVERDKKWKSINNKV